MFESITDLALQKGGQGAVEGEVQGEGEGEGVVVAAVKVAEPKVRGFVCVVGWLFVDLLVVSVMVWW